MINKNDLEALAAANEVITRILTGQIPDPLTISPDFTDLSIPVSQLVYNIQLLNNQYIESYEFIIGLSKGNLDQNAPKNNQFASPFKQLHSDLLHLRWQVQQIAQGDYEQQVSFMGDFTASFNKMIESLRHKQVLEDELKEREKRLQETTGELQQVLKMKNKLFSIIAHDLRGPIGNTGNLIKLILDGDITDPDEIKRTLRMLYSSSESTYVLLENLLAWSGSQSKEITFNPGVHGIRPLFEDTIELYRSALEVKQLRISMQINPGLEARFDPAMIRTVIRNLVNNAVKFTPKGGSIQVGAVLSGGEVKIFVKDTGIGMSPEILSSLSNPSTTAVRVGTNFEKGHGLGLTLCFEMVNRHGSKLEVESTEGNGTTFSFRLKLL